MIEIKKHIGLLGLLVQDKVTAFKGVVESVSFDLYGCIQATVRPTKLDEKGQISDSRWFDVARLKVVNNKPVMEVPNFDAGLVSEGKHGPAEKPMR